MSTAARQLDGFLRCRAIITTAPNAEPVTGFLTDLTQRNITIQLPGPLQCRIGTHVRIEVHGLEAKLTAEVEVKEVEAYFAVFDIFTALFAECTEVARIAVDPIPIKIEIDGITDRAEMFDIRPDGLSIRVMEGIDAGTSLAFDHPFFDKQLVAQGVSQECAAENGAYTVTVKVEQNTRTDAARWRQFVRDAQWAA